MEWIQLNLFNSSPFAVDLSIFLMWRNKEVYDLSFSRPCFPWQDICKVSGAYDQANLDICGFSKSIGSCLAYVAYCRVCMKVFCWLRVEASLSWNFLLILCWWFISWPVISGCTCVSKVWYWLGISNYSFRVIGIFRFVTAFRKSMCLQMLLPLWGVINLRS